MIWLRVVVLGAVAMVLSIPSSVPAATIPDPKIQAEAALITPGQLSVLVDFACQQGTDTGIFVGVNQPTVGVPDTNGGGFANLEASGERQTVEVLVNAFSGVWTPGDASANVQVSCGVGAFGRESAEIVIELP